jgi:hypothetical protein
MKIRDGIVLAATMLALASTSAQAQSGWRSIGGIRAAPDAGSVTINAREDGSYREYMICIEGGPARLTDLVVHYRDNRVQTYRLRARIADGACSRATGLSGRDHLVATMDVGYDPASLQGARPRFDLYVR